MGTGSGYGVVTLPSHADAVGSLEGSGETGSVGHTSLTDGLDCTEMLVDAYDVPAGAAVDLETGSERVLIPVGEEGTITIDGRYAVPHDGVARLPPNRPGTVGADDATSLLVVSVPPMAVDGGEPTIIDLETIEFDVPETSYVATAFLTGPLSCTAIKVNARVLERGQAVPYHTEGTQEELFVPLEGGSMRIDDERIDAPRGTVVRVAPKVPRSAVNDDRDRGRWLMFGAPPTGGPQGWDPGAETLE